MVKKSLFVRLEAKSGKATELEEFLKGALPLARAEPDTTAWFAVKFDNKTFAIFDAFPNEEGRQAHLSGKIAAALMEKAPELLASEPKIEKCDVLESKLP
ncbi:MAG: putative quinol monooxygenase [Pyrinomonadaceae bacterium]